MPQFLRREGPHPSRRAAKIQVATFQHPSFQHKATGSKQHPRLDDDFIHHNSTHTDQAFVANGTTMQYHFVTDSDIVANGKRGTARIPARFMTDMQYGQVLHVGTRTNHNAVHVTTNHRTRPDRGIVSQRHISHDARRWVNINALAELRRNAKVWGDVG